MRKLLRANLSRLLHDRTFRWLSALTVFFGVFMTVVNAINTIALLLIDPLYLSILCGLFGGGDVNGIALLMPEWVARVGFGVLLLVNGLVIWKRVLPVYSRSFSDTTEVRA